MPMYTERPVTINDAPLPSSAPESKPKCFTNFGRYEHVQGDCDTCFWGYACLHTTPGGGKMLSCQDGMVECHAVEFVCDGCAKRRGSCGLAGEGK